MRRGHVSIIVGGSRGIGQALGRALAARGGSVFVIGRNIQRINDTVKDLGSLGSGKHIGRALDASAPDDMTEMVAVCAENYGRIDLLVFSAIASAEDNASQLPLQVLDLPIAAWRKALDVNLHGAFLANQAVLPLMIRQGGGDILNVGSALRRRGMRGRAHAAAYAATKFALAAFTHSLASEVSEHGVRVNVVFPGPVRTPLIERTPLAIEFGGQMTAEHFVLALLDLLEFPVDCVPADPYILPMMGGLSTVSSRGAASGERS
jgi:NAD(P)-dependent dehydrogenase (short-subunit alcohol dehydrogenase family)